MINKKLTVCALALGFLALTACSPATENDKGGDKQSADQTSDVTPVDSSTKTTPIAGTYHFYVDYAYTAAYVFGESEILGVWPGTTLSTIEGDTTWKKVDVTVTDAANDHIIFNGRDGKQTANLDFPSTVGTYYFVNEKLNDDGQYVGEFLTSVLEISGKNKALVGKTGDLTLKKVGLDGNPVWSSSNTKVATVAADSTDPLKATWNAVAAGEANITVDVKDGDKTKTATFKVTVEAAESETDLTLWLPTNDNEFMGTVIEGYKKANPTFKGNITIKANYGEGDVRTELAKDLDTAADVMCIADDNIRSAAASKLLVGLTDDEKAAIKTSDGDAGVEAGSYDGTLYGYPYRADNGYILFYNKSVFDSTTITSLDDMLTAAKNKGKKVYFDLGTGWYAPAPFWGNGVTFGLDKDGNMTTTFDSDAAVQTGLALMKQYKTYGGDTLVYSSSTDTIEAGFKDGTIAACVLWNDYKNLKTAIGDNLGVATLPSMEINGATKQLHTFNGYKMMSVKAGLSDSKTALAKSFCEYATSKAMQLERAKELGYGPSNLEVAAMDDVKKLPFVGQIATMVAEGRTHAQAPNVNDNFWTPAGSIGTTIKDGAANDTWSTYGTGENGARAFFASVKEQMEKKIA